MYKVFNDLFEQSEDIIREFTAPADALEGAFMLLARYQYEDYSGEAVVIYEKDDKIFEVHDSHCSCNGLEGQWQPEETSWDALRMQTDLDIQEMCKGQPFVMYAQKVIGVAQPV